MEHEEGHQIEEDARNLTIFSALETQTDSDCVGEQGEHKENGKHQGINDAHGAPQVIRGCGYQEDARDQDHGHNKVAHESGDLIQIEIASRHFQEASHSTLLLVDHRDQDGADDVQADHQNQQYREI